MSVPRLSSFSGKKVKDIGQTQHGLNNYILFGL